MTIEMAELFIDEGGRLHPHTSEPRYEGDVRSIVLLSVDLATRAAVQVGIQIGLLLASGDPVGQARGQTLQIQIDLLEVGYEGGPGIEAVVS